MPSSFATAVLASPISYQLIGFFAVIKNLKYRGLKSFLSYSHLIFLSYLGIALILFQYDLKIIQTIEVVVKL